MTAYRCGAAWLSGGAGGPVDIECDAGLITRIIPAGSDPGLEIDDVLPGVVFPGFADAHSHLFHRGLRGRTHGGAHRGGTFWTWRETMYRLASRLDPDRFRELALATYVELVCAGFTAVGEFHYLHHGPGGKPYDDPNLMGLAAVQAGADAGLAVTLLDVAYLAGGFDEPVGEVQQRFSDRSADRWAARVAALPSAVRVGAAIHSVRAVPRAALPVVAEVAADRGWVLHAHVSEQPAENDACLAATGRTPVALLARAGAVHALFAAVHATHLAPSDIAELGDARASVVVCPTTEADLADGLPAAGALAAAGAALALGGDQHVITDPFAQARGLEYGERLATGMRGTFAPADLVHAATAASHAAIASPAGRIAVGAPADLVAIRTDTARTAGADPDQLVMAAAAADVEVVVVAGRVQARQGQHVRFGDPGRLLAQAIGKAWE